MSFIRLNKKYQNLLSKGFDCGNDVINSFLCKNEALDSSIGTTYIYLNNSRTQIIAYFNVGTGALIDNTNEYDNRLGGSAHLNYFALDKRYHGIKLDVEKELADLKLKISDLMLVKCLSLILKVKKRHIGFSFITLYSTKQGYNLYKRNGFEDLDIDMELPISYCENNCKPMYMPIIDL